jgi:hypothetical protein
MPIMTVVRSGTSPGGQDIVLAIVGGTLLTLAFTKPRLRWVERLTRDSSTSRLWIERGMTILVFGVGGYAWATLFLTLHGQLDHKSAALVRGAAYLLITYAWLTHFEPFVDEQPTVTSVCAAAFAYTGSAIFAACIGIAGAEAVRTSSLTSGIGIMKFAALAALGCFALSWLTPRLDLLLDRAIDRLTVGPQD